MPHLWPAAAQQSLTLVNRFLGARQTIPDAPRIESGIETMKGML